MLTPVRTVAPTEPMLTLDEAKAHLRVDHSDEDTLITALIGAVESHLDGYNGVLGRAIMTQTWAIEFPTFQSRLDLPLAPMQSATVQYYDSTNTLQTLATSVYAALSDGLGPYISLKYNQQWPQTYTRDDAVKVTWVAGYGASSSTIPVPLKAAALLLVARLYDNRSAVNVGNITTELPLSIAALIAPFRRVGV